MNLKLLLGIFIPLIVIVVLVVLSSTDIGFSIEKENEKNLQYNILFTTQSQAGDVKIQTIKVKNDYFLPKKIELPKLMVCLYDKDGKAKSQNLYVRYNEGKASEIPETTLAEELLSARSYYGYNYYATARAIEVPAHSQKEVKVMVQPKYSYNYDYYNKAYTDYEYDELLIIEPKDKNDYYSSNSCANLDDKDLDEAIHIGIINIPTAPVTQNQQSTATQSTKYSNINPSRPDSDDFSKPIITCVDSDDGRNSTVAGFTTNGRSIRYDNCFHNQLGFVPECDGETCILIEYFCADDNTLAVNNYKCPAGCKNGACIQQ